MFDVASKARGLRAAEFVPIPTGISLGLIAATLLSSLDFAFAKLRLRSG